MAMANQGAEPIFTPQQSVEQKKKFWQNKKIVASVAVLIVAVIAIIVVLILGLNFQKEAIQKSTVLLPFFLPRDR